MDETIPWFNEDIDPDSIEPGDVGRGVGVEFEETVGFGVGWMLHLHMPESALLEKDSGGRREGLRVLRKMHLLGKLLRYCQTLCVLKLQMPAKRGRVPLTHY